jgi:Thioredoxin
MDWKALWEEGYSFAEFVAAAAPEHRALWEGIYRASRVPEWATKPPAEERKLLVLAEDWCVDTSSTLPVLARWVEATPGLSLRILKRDEHPEVMDRYLSNGTRSIPVVLVLDRDLHLLRHWGPYSVPLASWVREHKPPALVKDEFVKGKRSWYARDRGETTLREVMAVL